MAEPAPVLLVANFADRVGGGEESMLTLARGLDRRRYVPQAVVPAEGEIAEALRRLGIPVAVLPLPPLRPWTAPAVLRSLRALGALLKEWRPILVHAHGSRGALYAGLAARRLHIPVIWHVRIADPDPRLDPLLLRLSTRIIAISQAVRSRFPHGASRDKVQVVYNGIDPQVWPLAEEDPSAAEAPRILLVGRLSVNKGQATLIHAMPTILQSWPKARAVLLGRDEEGEELRLRRLAKELRVVESVEFSDWTVNPQPQYRAATVVVLPSRSEGFGRTLVEAALTGRPVVASRVGGIPEVVLDGETGFLVSPDDPVLLADRILSLLGNRSLRLRMGAAGRRHALASFTIQEHARGVMAIYAEILPPASCGSLP